MTKNLLEMTTKQLDLIKMAEFDRGYQQGKKAKSAKESYLKNKRQEVIRRLRTVDVGNIHRKAFCEEVFRALSDTDFNSRPANLEIIDRLIFLLGENNE